MAASTLTPGADAQTRSFERELTHRLAAIHDRGLDRFLRRVDSPQGPRIRLGDRHLVNFSSNDYLGLAQHPAVKAAAVEAVERHGAGSGASRLICGSLAPHHELEEALADFKGAAGALSFSSGYATAWGTLGSLIGRNDTVILDKRVHACLVDAARLSGATLRVFPHNDLNALERILSRVHQRSRSQATGSDAHSPRTLIVTESLFSMDGDVAPLREIVSLKERYGAWLMVDEAHATGLYGERRRGRVDALGLGSQIEVQMGTLGKALGAAGGYICGSRALINLLINRARPFIFSTAPVPAAAAAAREAIRIVRSPLGQELCDGLWLRVDRVRTGLAQLGYSLTDPASPILPLILGDERRAVEFSDRLRDRGFFIPAVRFPAVPFGHARLRLTVSAVHDLEDIDRLLAALAVGSEATGGA